MQQETLRAKFIREAEQTIDTGLRTLERLAAEATEIEVGIEEARQVIQALRNGHDPDRDKVKGIVEERLRDHDKALHAPPATGTATKATELAVPMPEQAPQPHKPKRKAVRLSNEEFVRRVAAFGDREFTARELAKVTGMSESAVQGRLHKIPEVKRVSEFVFRPGRASAPARWRLKQGSG